MPEAVTDEDGRIVDGHRPRAAKHGCRGGKFLNNARLLLSRCNIEARPLYPEETRRGLGLKLSRNARKVRVCLS